MTELSKKVQRAINYLQALCPEDGYFFADSGGKDSTVCRALLNLAGVKYDGHYSVTSVDPPELVTFIKTHHPETNRDIPRDNEGQPITMWNLIPQKGFPPTRIARYCCQKLKESAGDGRATITGVRWAESASRNNNAGLVRIPDKKASKELADNPNFLSTPKGGVILTNDNDESRQIVENCIHRYKVTINPIIDFTNADIWEFIRGYGIPYCELYDEGFHRLGCIGCPMAGTKTRDFEFYRWPIYKQHYLHAFEKLIANRKERGLFCGDIWESPERLFNWWMEYDIVPGQLSMF